LIAFLLAVATSPPLKQIQTIQLGSPLEVIHAQESPDLTFEEAVKLALANNPRIRALAFDLEAAERGVSSASSLANPSITFTPGLTRAGSDEELLVAQPLEISGTRAARTGVARAQQRIVQAQALAELRETVFTVKSAYVDLARAQERRSLTADLAKHATEVDVIAQRQVELGSRAGVDRTQTSIEANRAKQQATLAQADYEAALAAFNTEIGRSAETSTRVASLTSSQPSTNDEATLLSQALASRSELLLSKARQEEFRQEAKLSKAEGFPDLVPQYRMESLTRSPRDGGFGIGITLPILDYGSLRNRTRQAEASQRAEEQRQAGIEAKVRQEVIQALARLRAAEEVIKTFEGGMLAEAKKLLDTTRAGFGLGETSLITVLDAQRTFRSVQSEYIEALASHAHALAQLERATGSVPASLIYEIPRKEVTKK